MIELNEGKLFQAIEQLNGTQFPEATVDDFCNKAVEELDEVLNAPKSKRLGEFADAMICIWAGAAKDGWSYTDLMLAMATKTTVNRVRKFERTESGTYQHIENQ